MNELIICPKCDGEGYNLWEEDRFSGWTKEDCKHCNSTGRVRKYVWQTHVPSDVDQKYLNDLDCNIYELIRELQKSIKKQ